MEHKTNFAAKHPLVTFVFTIAVFSLPQWFQSIWSLFFSNPPVPAIFKYWKENDMPTFSPYWITVPLGLVMFAYLIYEIKKSKGQATAGAKASEQNFVSMTEATTRAYEQLRAHESLWAEVADKFSGSKLGKTREEGVRLYIATALTTQHVPIYGKRPPSRLYELIKPDELKRGGFSDNGVTFAYYGEKSPLYVDIAVRSDELEKAIEQMKIDTSKAI